MNYLGIPISNKHLGARIFEGVVGKMRNKLQPWKGRNMSSGGRLILTNSSLSSIPRYLMRMFMLGESTHQQMDSIRSTFFWRGVSDKFKYHMMEWENLCLPKDYGGLGIINTRTMNEALLTKWIWRLYTCDDNDPCCRLL